MSTQVAVPARVDEVLPLRLDGLQSSLRQAWDHVRDQNLDDAETVERLERLAELLACARETERPKEERLRIVTQVDAELCLYEPPALLRADRIRLEDRFFRLRDGPRKAWKDSLARYDEGKGDERQYRQQLRYLTYELAAAAKEFERLSAERRNALFGLTWRTATVFALLLVAFLAGLLLSPAWPGEGRMAEGKVDLLMTALPPAVTLTLMISGMLGAIVFVFRSVLADAKLRPENVHVLFLNVLVRVGFGALYALVVVFGILAGLLPIQVPVGGTRPLMFLVVASIAAGLSDKLFGTVIAGLIESSRSKDSASSKDKSQS